MNSKKILIYELKDGNNYSSLPHPSFTSLQRDTWWGGLNRELYCRFHHCAVPLAHCVVRVPRSPGSHISRLSPQLKQIFQITNERIDIHAEES
jgi:hypothetical protein